MWLDREGALHVLLPYLVGDLREAPRRGHPRDLRSLPLLEATEPRAQRAGPAHRLRGRDDQRPAQQPVAFLADVARPDPIGTGPHPRRQANVARHVLRAGKARDVRKLEHEQDRDERPEAGNGLQALHPRIAGPAPGELLVRTADLGVQESEQGHRVIADRPGRRVEAQLREFTLASDAQPARGAPRLEIPPCEQGEQTILDAGPQPHQAHAVPQELPRFADLAGRNPYRGEEVAS
jgi:hypothetical protein